MPFFCISPPFKDCSGIARITESSRELFLVTNLAQTCGFAWSQSEIDFKTNKVREEGYPKLRSRSSSARCRFQGGLGTQLTPGPDIRLAAAPADSGAMRSNTAGTTTCPSSVSFVRHCGYLAARMPGTPN